MDNTFRSLQNYLGANRIKKDISLAEFTTLKIGGKATYFYEAQTHKELILAIKACCKNNLPFFIFGGGSNLLISDSGFPGLVIRNRTNSIRILGYKGNVTGKSSNITNVFLEVDTGVQVNRLVRFSIDENLEGLENFLGQPGSVGGAIYINAHNMKAKDFFGDHLFQATIISSKGDERIERASYFKFDYDQSILQKSKETVASCILNLKKSNKELLWKKALNSLNYRKENQPLGIPSAGCTFRNITGSEAHIIATPNFTTSAGYLIDRIGLKGKKVGGAQISPIHANFILNIGGAKATDVLELITLAKEKVKQKFGITLKEEIVLLGFNTN